MDRFDILISNVSLINENLISKKDIYISNDKIARIAEPGSSLEASTTIDGSDKYLIPGVIDDQVHFREPGLTHKADIASESAAAVAGGITSLMEMPNTNPQTTTIDELNKKYELGAASSLANYSFYMGATNENLDELLKVNPKEVCGIKVFMGSSTGNMLVNDPVILSEIFRNAPTLIATHCEDDSIINANTERFKNQYGEEIPIHLHPEIRSAEACYRSSSLAAELASKYDTQLHILHLSTEKELSLLSNKPLPEKNITGEVCVHHLWFEENDYNKYGTKIKWNPAVKKASDRDALLNALNNDILDVVATDHAPHTLEEKDNSYLKAPSGGPLVQHSLVAMLELYHKEKISLEKVVQKMCHAPADLFKIANRGYVREGYYADLVLLDLNSSWEVKKENILYKCGWSPFNGSTFNSKITHTFVNGKLVYENGMVNKANKGMRLTFNR